LLRSGPHVPSYAPDASGNEDELSGRGTGILFSLDDDDLPITLSFTATPDETPPRLVASTRHPLESLSFVASEPLEDAPTLVLHGPMELEFEVDDDFMSFHQIDPVVLPFSGVWTLDVTGTDLAGHAFEAAEYRTLDGPGFFAQDGFEGEFFGILEDGQLVTAYGSTPALSGMRSLFIEGDSPVTLLLARSPEHSTLRFSFRAFSSDLSDGDFGEAAFDAPHVTIAVPGARPSPGFAVEDGGGGAGGAASYRYDPDEDLVGTSLRPYVSELVDASVPIEDPGSSVIVLFAAVLTEQCHHDVCDEPTIDAYLIDDVRLE
jgi:hypothetical protein